MWSQRLFINVNLLFPPAVHYHVLVKGFYFVMYFRCFCIILQKRNLKWSLAYTEPNTLNTRFYSFQISLHANMEADFFYTPDTSDGVRWCRWLQVTVLPSLLLFVGLQAPDDPACVAVVMACLSFRCLLWAGWLVSLCHSWI